MIHRHDSWLIFCPDYNTVASKFLKLKDIWIRWCDTTNIISPHHQIFVDGGWCHFYFVRNMTGIPTPYHQILDDMSFHLISIIMVHPLSQMTQIFESFRAHSRTNDTSAFLNYTNPSFVFSRENVKNIYTGKLTSFTEK